MRLLIFLCSLCLTVPAIAATPTTALAGTWVLASNGQSLMTIEIRHDRAGWSAIETRPKHWTSDCESLSGVAGPAEPVVSTFSQEMPNGVQITIGDPHPAPPEMAEVVMIRPRADGTATMISAYTCGGPVTLRRVVAVPKMTDWDAEEDYPLPIPRATNPEMTAIFDADQADRADPPHIDWTVVTPRDIARRTQTQALLDAGNLESGDDFFHAAFVFQHGDVPADFLKAHILALIAAARGKAGATWIAAATLDRYLIRIGQPQIFGTQFAPHNGKWTQEPYDHTLLSDGMRVAAHVPTLADQQKQLEEYEAQFSAARK